MNTSSTTTKIEKDDIQGLLIRGHSNLSHALYCLLAFTDVNGAKDYLQSICEDVTPGDTRPTDEAIHIAFTYTGLDFIGLHDATLHTFSRQFKEGMTEDHRRFVLGDQHLNDPMHWSWGGPNNQELHMLLLLYAKDEATLDNLYRSHQTHFATHQITEVETLDSHILPAHKEHFGFRDGLSQPFIDGFSSQVPEKGRVFPTGEFVLGYHNWYEQYPDSPSVEAAHDTEVILPVTPDGKNKDFGKNGSYLIFRQMSQDVPAFWNYMKTASYEPNSENEKDAAIKLASKMVGRWPSGCPLVKSPDVDVPELAKEEFNFWNEDFHGLKCPVGAHIRRTNPRDWLLTEKTALESEEMVLKHRLLRRGRPYGKPIVESMKAEDLMQATEDNEERGLHFICFAGDLIRQFEFVQNAWVKFHKFGGLYEDSDPIIGTHFKNGEMITDTFSVQAKPVRRRYKDVPQFTQVRGGAYFFFPGLKAIKYLASL